MGRQNKWGMARPCGHKLFPGMSGHRQRPTAGRVLRSTSFSCSIALVSVHPTQIPCATYLADGEGRFGSTATIHPAGSQAVTLLLVVLCSLL